YDYLLLCFFFFQAEDGIRDSSVTGVQTCALPICTACRRAHMPYRFSTQTRRCPPLRNMRPAARCTRVQLHRDTRGTLLVSLRTRSEERRVGRECRDVCVC